MRLLIATLILVGQATTIFASEYYPKSYKELFSKGYSENANVKESLYLLLVKSHLKVDGQEDELVNSCKNQGSCYRHNVLGYKQARRILFGKLHLKQDVNGYFIKDIYCERRITRRNTHIGPGIIPKNSVMNTEHTWPQSRFSNAFPKSMQKSDLHHLFPSSSHANMVRGNSEFAEVDGFPVRDCKGAFEGVQRSKFSGSYFEPPSAERGNIARALFYFSVRYKMKIRPTEEAYLRKWHEDDPVDQDEIDRNAGIYEVQGNRNPFIDYPHLVDEVKNF